MAFKLPPHVDDALTRYVADKATDADRQLLQTWFPTNAETVEWPGTEEDLESRLRFLQAEVHKITNPEPVKTVKNVKTYHRVHFLRTSWFRYAAAIVLVFGVGSVVFLDTTSNKNKSFTTHTSGKTLEDIDPGTHKAILTLADGSTVMLDSTNSGAVAEQGGMRIQQKNGQLAYAGEAPELEGSTIYNVLSTPRGGQYRLTLPDGTRVWLNAASSIRYPISFNGPDREVTLTGEGYFEVTGNAAQPFRVITGDQKLEVLGTQFNINAYTDEAGIKTTLIEGSVRVNPLLNGNAPVILIPGQQSSLTNKVLKVKEVNTEDETAWKNDLFAFNDSDFKSIMRQLSRWYNVDFEFRGTLPGKQLIGNVSRNYNIEQVLKMIAFTTGIQYEMKDGKIILSSK